MDVVDSDRPMIFKHIIEKFGADKTARVASFGTLVDKSVIDEICRAFMYNWNESHGRKYDDKSQDNPYNYSFSATVKSAFASDPEKARKKYPEIFKYFDGLVGTKVSQSVHPAGMVISPIVLKRYYGTFDKDGEECLMMDMNEAHEVGAAKYDFLVLKTVQVIRDICRYIEKPYPKSNEIDWNDKAVWQDITTNPLTIFQFESPFAADCLRKFKPQNLFEMSLVTACIRPVGESYRNDLLRRLPHHNPSEIIDKLLEDNNGYLVYQEDVIKFLQEICGLSGGEADNIRRAIGHKDRDRLDEALPKILEGYCNKSPKDRSIAEKEAMDFIQILIDSASYMFNYSHSIAYCMLGYFCAYYRHYHPLAYITAFLNNSANDDDIKNGSELASKLKIKMVMPKFGYSTDKYTYNEEQNIIAKGTGSLKYISQATAEGLYKLGTSREFTSFIDVLTEISKQGLADSRQMDVLIKTDYFSDFGNQRELLRIYEIFDLFKQGEAVKIKREKVDGTPLEDIVRRYATSKTKSGEEAKSYTFTNLPQIMLECEQYIKCLNLPDLEDVLKVQNFADIMGYVGYVSGNDKDRRKLYVKEIFPVCRKKDGKQFGYSVITQSVGSGREGRFTVFNRVYDQEPIKKGDIIRCINYKQDGKYFTLTDYTHALN